MYFKKLNLVILLLAVIVTRNSAFAITDMASDNSFVSTQMYITDEFEVTMRSGTSTSNEILMLLKSGQALMVLDVDLESQYSLVESENGKRGYVLSRYLVDLPSARQRLALLQQTSTTQKQDNQELRAEISNLRADLANQLATNENLKNRLQASEAELDRVSIAAENTLDTLDQNRAMAVTIADLQEQQSLLTQENASLRDSTKMDWFLRGGAVSLIAFLIGILITRIRWRKQESWGAY